MSPVIGLAIAAVAWGALSFGAVYPWAYWPLFAVAALAGVVGLLTRRSDAVRCKSVAFGTGLIVAGVALQLAPLPRWCLERLSPSTDRILRRLDIGYAFGVVSAHPMSIDPDATRLALVALVTFGIFTVGLAKALSHRGPTVLAHSIVSIGVLLALIGVVQRASGTDRIYGFWQPYDHPFQIFGPFVNRNHFAGWMIMALSLAMGLLCGRMMLAMHGVRRDWRSRVLWWSSADANQLVLVAFAIVVMALALVLTRSRSGILCFAATLALTMWFAFNARAPQGGRNLRRRLVGIAVVTLGLLAVSWAGIDPLVGRFANEQALSGRLGAWSAAIRIARDFPLTGTGLNTYGTAMLFYQPPELTAHWNVAHNDYVQLIAEGGLLLGVPIALWLVLLAREVLQRLRTDDNPMTYWTRVGAVVGLIGIGLQEVVDFSLQIPGDALLFVVLCAIAIHPPRARLARRSMNPIL